MDRFTFLQRAHFSVTLPTMGRKSHTFTVVLEPAEEGGFIVTVPALPELGTQGDTYDEAMANAREAIELVIEDRLARESRSRPTWNPKLASR
jgi:predicted RNase H-like HicB family nuclease